MTIITTFYQISQTENPNISNGVLDSAKQFLIGVVSTAIIAPLVIAGSFIAQNTGLIEKQARQFTCPTNLTQGILGLKTSTILSTGCLVPIFEEFIFRELIQEELLTKLPRYIIKNVSPGNEIIMDSQAAKIARITITTTLFSAYHLINLATFPSNYVKAQMVATSILGIGLGILKESSAGLTGSLGCHMAYNLTSLLPYLVYC